MNMYTPNSYHKSYIYKIITSSITYTQLSFISSYNFFINLKFLIYCKPSLSFSLILFLTR